MSTQLHRSQLALRDAQVATATAALKKIDTTSLDESSRELLDEALRVLRSPAPEGSAPSVDVGVRAQRAAEEHLSACEDAMYEEDNGDSEELPESPACGPFCGCSTCVVREV